MFYSKININFCHDQCSIEFPYHLFTLGLVLKCPSDMKEFSELTTKSWHLGKNQLQFVNVCQSLVGIVEAGYFSYNDNPVESQQFFTDC